MRRFRDALVDMLSGAIVAYAHIDRFEIGDRAAAFLAGRAVSDLAVFILSIWAGIWSVGVIVSLVERQEYRDAAAARASTTSKLPPRASSLVFVGDSTAATCAMVQQVLFLVGLVGFIVVAVIDRITFTR
jgi:hypothetical protein